jgi:hypothetical protein
MSPNKKEPDQSGSPSPGDRNSAVMYVTCMLGGEEMRMEVRSSLVQKKGYERIDGNIWQCIVVINDLLQRGDTLYHYRDPESAAIALAGDRIKQWRKNGRHVMVKTWKVMKEE